MGFAKRVGLFNIGGEGQLHHGHDHGPGDCTLGPRIPVLHWMLAMLGAIVIGSLWGGMVGLLKAKYEVSEVVSTIMLNYVALYLSRIICLQLPGATTYNTANFPETALIGNAFFQKITNNSLLNNGIFMMAAQYWSIGSSWRRPVSGTA
jgi:simple sugar transport system permease protein